MSPQRGRYQLALQHAPLVEEPRSEAGDPSRERELRVRRWRGADCNKSLHLPGHHQRSPDRGRHCGSDRELPAFAQFVSHEDPRRDHGLREAVLDNPRVQLHEPSPQGVLRWTSDPRSPQDQGEGQGEARREVHQEAVRQDCPEEGTFHPRGLSGRRDYSQEGCPQDAHQECQGHHRGVRGGNPGALEHPAADLARRQDEGQTTAILHHGDLHLVNAHHDAGHCCWMDGMAAHHHRERLRSDDYKGHQHGEERRGQGQPRRHCLRLAMFSMVSDAEPQRQGPWSSDQDRSTATDASTPPGLRGMVRAETKRQRQAVLRREPLALRGVAAGPGHEDVGEMLGSKTRHVCIRSMCTRHW